MKRHEKQTFVRFLLVYLIISFLLFLALATIYYFDKKRDFENQLAIETSKFAQEYRDFGEVDAPQGISVALKDKGKLPYPAFLKDAGIYKNTSCAGSIDPKKMIVVSVSKKLVKNRLQSLQERVFEGMLLLFGVNFMIGLLLSYFALQPVKRANEQFLEFVDDVIHDLNAPVSALSINAESLAQECSSKKIKRILRSLESIQNIYKNLSVLLQERNKPEYQTLQLREACTKTIEQLQTIYPQATFELDIPDIMIKVDPIAFERILTNLVENSVKYATSDPLIKIAVDKRNYFYIQDNGSGFKNVDFLNTRHQQSSKTNKGYGLGLSIVKRLSEECGIELTIESTLGEGSTFYFDIRPIILSVNK